MLKTTSSPLWWNICCLIGAGILYKFLILFLLVMPKTQVIQFDQEDFPSERFKGDREKAMTLIGISKKDAEHKLH